MLLLKQTEHMGRENEWFLLKLLIFMSSPSKDPHDISRKKTITSTNLDKKLLSKVFSINNSILGKRN
jgi:galactose-1-phosphate uridylyltransferase